MSRFDDLCKEYAASRTRYFNYRDECEAVAGSLIAGLVSHLGCPEETISFHPSNEADEKPETFYSLMGVMNMQKDTYWHFKVGILVHIASDISPKQRNLFEFTLKKKDGRFVVKVTTDGKEFAFVPNDAGTFTPIYDEVFQLMMTRYRTGLDKFLEKDDQVRKIGFEPTAKV